MAIDNNKKTELIKKSLRELSCHLKWEINEFNEVIELAINDRYILPFYDIDPVVNLLKILYKFEFKSVDDFNSVKKLREIELYFLNNKHNLEKFTFPSYESLIDPILLNHANIEIELDNFDKKGKELLSRGHRTASTQTGWVVFILRELIKCHFQDEKIDNPYYLKEALAVIDSAKPILGQHLGCMEILGNLFLLILTLGTAHFANKMVNNHFLFFRETESAKQLNQLEQTVIKSLKQ